MSRTRVNNFRLEARRDANQCFAVRVVDSANLARIAWLETDINDQAELIKWADHWIGMEGLVFTRETPTGGQPLILNRVTVSNYQREIRMIQQALIEEPNSPNRLELEQRIVMLNSRLISGDRIEQRGSPTSSKEDLDKRAKLIQRWADSGSTLSLNDWIEQQEGGTTKTEMSIEEELEKEVTKL